MKDWPEGNMNYTFEKVTEKHKPLIETFWSLGESLCLEDKLRLHTFEYSKEVRIGRWISIEKVFKKIFMF